MRLKLKAQILTVPNSLSHLKNPLKPTQNAGPTWDDRYRERTKRIVFGEQPRKKKIMNVVEEEEERGEEERKRVLARALLQAALDGPDEEEEGLVGVEDQKSLSVGLVGAPNAGKSALTNYMAVKRPWDEDPFTMSEEVMKNISLEVVRERLLDHVHQEIPYEIDHRLMDWKELRDGSLRIEQHFTTHKQSRRRILVGKNGSNNWED